MRDAYSTARAVLGRCDADGYTVPAHAAPRLTYPTATRAAVVDTYHGTAVPDPYRWLEDVGLMKSLNLQAYRFSIAWSRVLPSGKGQVNSKGLDYYNRLVDALLDKNITPFITLFHWDMPLVLERRGGWLDRESAAWFAE